MGHKGSTQVSACQAASFLVGLLLFRSHRMHQRAPLTLQHSKPLEAICSLCWWGHEDLGVCVAGCAFLAAAVFSAWQPLTSGENSVRVGEAAAGPNGSGRATPLNVRLLLVSCGPVSSSSPRSSPECRSRCE